MIWIDFLCFLEQLRYRCIWRTPYRCAYAFKGYLILSKGCYLLFLHAFLPIMATSHAQYTIFIIQTIISYELSFKSILLFFTNVLSMPIML